mgnify:CR=1 FL=1
MNFIKIAELLKLLSLLILVMLFFSCENNEEKFVKEWQSKKMIIPHTSHLKIKSDHTFEYTDSGCQWIGNSFGNWKVLNDTLILNSVPSKKCQYVIGYGNNFKMSKIIDGKFIAKKTFTNCIPINQAGEYVTFTNDKFYIKNDTLEYVTNIKFQFNDRIAFFRKK